LLHQATLLHVTCVLKQCWCTAKSLPKPYGVANLSRLSSYLLLIFVDCVPITPTEGFYLYRLKNILTNETARNARQRIDFETYYRLLSNSFQGMFNVLKPEGYLQVALTCNHHFFSRAFYNRTRKSSLLRTITFCFQSRKLFLQMNLFLNSGSPTSSLKQAVYRN